MIIATTMRYAIDLWFDRNQHAAKTGQKAQPEKPTRLKQRANKKIWNCTNQVCQQIGLIFEDEASALN